MKRAPLRLEDIVHRDNLLNALRRAALGKHDRPAVRAWLDAPDQRCTALRQAVLAGAAPSGDFHAFVIRDPKRRVIHAAPFADRVLHHAVMQFAGPVIERALVADSFACVPGRGAHAAVHRVQALLRRFPWCVKIDVKGYFPSIDHERLNALLAAKFKGNAMPLLRRIVSANGGEAGRGLPIGSLCSQHFANLYLDGCDRLISETLGCPARVRYMDDTLWWCNSKDEAKKSLTAVREWLNQERGLTLHPNPQINRSQAGVTFCGYRISPSAIRLTRRRKHRYVQARQRIEQAWCSDEIDDLGLQRGYAAVHAITLPADAKGFRRADLVRHPAPAL